MVYKLLDRIGYKVLGMAVWHGGKWYLHRRYPGAARKSAIAAVAAVAFVGLAAAAAAQRKTPEEQ
jgi:hypothetical protein